MSFVRRRSVLRVEQLEDRNLLSGQSFVDGMYRDLLFRAEPTTSANFLGWQGQAGDFGSQNRVNVFFGFWFSAEHRGIEVNSYYRSYLHRDPETTGARQHWVDRFNAGEQELDMKRDFVTSQEYINAHPTPGAYVQGLYTDILARFPSDQETAYWVNAMSFVGPPGVAQGILTSKEAYTNLLNNIYTNLLNRNPDSNGFSFWVNQLTNGQRNVRDVIEAFTLSPEYDSIATGPPTTSVPNAHKVDSALQFFAF